MSIRKVPLISGEYYHVFNHGIDYRDVCLSEREYKRLILTLWFYQPIQIQFKLSQYLILSKDVQQNLINEINQKPKLVEIHAFSLMPNHYHILIKQLVHNGISTFVSNVQISYSKYYNAKHQRKGSLFLSPFHAKHIQTQEQFMHVARYIHLNHFSNGFIKNIDNLITNPHTSLPYYFSSMPTNHPMVTTDQLTNMFPNSQKHWEFIKDQSDYQRQLYHIKHLIIE